MVNTDETTLEFFKRRFPSKNIEFEKQCGYFGEWTTRFESGKPELWMDFKSREVWEQMKKEGYS